MEENRLYLFSRDLISELTKYFTDNGDVNKLAHLLCWNPAYDGVKLVRNSVKRLGNAPVYYMDAFPNLEEWLTSIPLYGSSEKRGYDNCVENTLLNHPSLRRFRISTSSRGRELKDVFGILLRILFRRGLYQVHATLELGHGEVVISGDGIALDATTTSEVESLIRDLKKHGGARKLYLRRNPELNYVLYQYAHLSHFYFSAVYFLEIHIYGSFEFVRLREIIGVTSELYWHEASEEDILSCMRIYLHLHDTALKVDQSPKYLQEIFPEVKQWPKLSVER